MSHVFISYSHQDADFVTKLDEIFQDENINTWVDKKRLKAGENWREAIDEGIKNAFALIVVLSPHAVISPYVTYEWSFALGIGLEIIPVACVPKPDIHPRLDILQYVDLSNEQDNSPKWHALITQIKEKQQNFRPHSINIPREAPPIVHSLVAKLNSEDEEQRKNAIVSLWDIDSSYAEEALIKALQHYLPDVRQWCARGLGYRRSKKAIPELSKLLQDDKYKAVRERTLEALIKIGTDEIVPALIIALKDSEEGIRLKSIQELGDMKASEAIPALIEILQSDVIHLIEATITALGKIGSNEVVPDLINMLQHGYPGIRKESVKALGEIRDYRAIPHLVNAHREDVNREVKDEVAFALNKMRIEDIPHLLETVADSDPYYRNRDLVVSVLQYQGDKVVPYLIKNLETAKSYIRKIILEALKRIGTPEAREALNRYK